MGHPGPWSHLSKTAAELDKMFGKDHTIPEGLWPVVSPHPTSPGLLCPHRACAISAGRNSESLKLREKPALIIYCNCWEHSYLLTSVSHLCGHSRSQQKESKRTQWTQATEERRGKKRGNFWADLLCVFLMALLVNRLLSSNCINK